MEATAEKRLTFQEYLELERKADIKSEFHDGEMFAMAGGTRRHSRIKTNFVSALNRRLEKAPCEVYDSDMRVRIPATGLGTYPDGSVACPEILFADGNEETLLNPKVIFEVLSDSTAAYDRGKKFWHYRHLESLTDYVLVSQDERLIEHYTRHESGAWLLDTVEGPEGVLKLKSIQCQVPLSEVYHKTDLKG